MMYIYLQYSTVQYVQYSAAQYSTVATFCFAVI